MSEPLRFKPVNPAHEMIYSTDGGWVSWEDYTRLKEDAERYRLASLRVDVGELHAQFNRALFDETVAQNARLKAEVERLTAFTTRTIIPNEELQAQVERLTKAVMHSPAAQLKLKELEGKTTFEEINPKDDNSNITTELLALSNRQASDIRRLTKAGDAMAEEIALAKRQDEGSRFDPIEMHYDHELIVKWDAAKEGKPHA